MLSTPRPHCGSTGCRGNDNLQCCALLMGGVCQVCFTLAKNCPPAPPLTHPPLHSLKRVCRMPTGGNPAGERVAGHPDTYWSNWHKKKAPLTPQDNVGCPQTAGTRTRACISVRVRPVLGPPPSPSPAHTTTHSPTPPSEISTISTRHQSVPHCHRQRGG